MSNFVCDLCGFSSSNLEEINTHLAGQHGVSDPGPLGSISQEDGVISLKHADGEEITVDLEAWLGDLLDGGEV